MQEQNEKLDLIGHAASEFAFLESLPGNYDIPALFLREGIKAVVAQAAALPEGRTDALFGAASALMSIATGQPLWGLTDEPDQWEPARGHVYRHKRCKDVVKSRDGKIKYEKAIMWFVDGGEPFLGVVDGVDSAQAVTAFPFMPKTFYVKVEPSGEDGKQFRIYERYDLLEVFGYYGNGKMLKEIV